MVAALNPARIIESGRARAQSTLVLARLFPRASIVSLESDPASPDVTVAAERLRECEQCRLSASAIHFFFCQTLVEAGDVVLIDGPKDFRALKLAFRLLRSGKPLAVFVHDLWLGSPARRFVDRYLPSVLLSDDPEWVQRYASLDSRRRSPPPVSNTVRHAYGATMGCFEASQENYSLRLLQSSAAQGADRIRETARKYSPPPINRATERFRDVSDFDLGSLGYADPASARRIAAIGAGRSNQSSKAIAPWCSNIVSPFAPRAPGLCRGGEKPRLSFIVEEVVNHQVRRDQRVRQGRPIRVSETERRCVTTRSVRASCTSSDRSSQGTASSRAAGPRTRGPLK